jgi:hypothetical protein
LPPATDEKSGCKWLPANAAEIVALFGSSGAFEMSVFHAFEDGNGTNPPRLPMFPRLMDPQDGAPEVEVTATVAEAFLVESCVDVAVMVAVSAVLGGVNVTSVPDATPFDALSVPPPDGLRVRFTVLVNEPVPVTVGVQVAV